MSNPEGINQYSKGGGAVKGLSPKRLARFKRDMQRSSDRIDKAQSDYAKKTGFAMPRGLAARNVAGRK